MESTQDFPTSLRKDDYMDGFSMSKEQNASIRGYIMRTLVKGYHFSYPVKSLSNKMIANGLITNPDITSQLYYLEECGLIAFTNKKVSALSAMQEDAVVRLTAKGIRFIEQGGDSEMGIDL